MNTYLQFNPPLSVSNTILKGRKLSQGQAVEFLGWLTAAVERRTNALLEYLKLDFDPDPERTLMQFGIAMKRTLGRREMANKGKLELLESGCSVAIDGGLLICRLLTLQPDLDARWEIFTHHPRAASYMLPVLRVCPEEEGLWVCDPLHEGNDAAIACLRDGSTTHWYRLYLVWRTRNFQAAVPDRTKSAGASRRIPRVTRK